MPDPTNREYTSMRASPRRRRRKRNLSLYYLMIFVLVMVVGVILSLTVLFKIEEISVIGDTIYDAETIIKSSKIKIGNNLLREDFSSAAELVKKELIFIETVNITRSFPEKVVITVEPAEPSVYISDKDKLLLISKSGKILEILTEKAEAYPIVYGFSPNNLEVGEMLISTEEHKDKLLKSLIAEISALNIKEIATIDITDRYNVNLKYGTRIEVQLGNPVDLNYKLRYAGELIKNKIPITKEGTLFMRGESEASFVEKGDLERYERELTKDKTVTSTIISSEPMVQTAVTTTAVSEKTSESSD